MTARNKLIDSLCRELVQAEHDADIHCRRQARQLGPSLPANVLLEISDHARRSWPGLVDAMGPKRKAGRGLAMAIGELFSATRHLLVDRIIGAQRAYRGTLLGLKHGLDCCRLLETVSENAGERELHAWCRDVHRERAAMIARADNALDWFATDPLDAIRPAWRMRST